MTWRAPGPGPGVVSWLVVLVYLCALGYEGLAPGAGAGAGTGIGTEAGVAKLVAAFGIAAGWLVVALRLGEINRYGLVSGACFGLVGVAALLGAGGAFWSKLFDSQAAFLKYILLYGSVIWLRIQAVNSRSLARMADWVLAASDKTRRFALPLMGHVMGAGFNLAGLGLLSPMIGSARSRAERRANFASMIHGFSLATAWSPVFASIIVVLAAFPNLAWLDIAPWTIGVAVGLFVVYQSVATNRTGFTGIKGQVGQPGPDGPRDPMPAQTAGNQDGLVQHFPVLPLVIVVSLLSLLTLFVLVTGAPVTLALGVIAPLFSVAWLLTKDSKRLSPRRYAVQVLEGLGKLHSEIFVFAMANLLAVGIAALVAAGSITPLSSGPAWLNWTLFAVSYLLVSGIGVHPLVIVLVGVQLLPASALGISDLQYAILILALWTSSTIGSPMSANNLMFSKLLQVPVWKLAWVWNRRAVVVNWVGAFALGLLMVR